MSAEKATWRQQSRWECSLETTIATTDGEVSAVVTDISEGGARLWCLDADQLAVNAEVTLQMPERGAMRGSVRYVVGSVVGLAFVQGANGSQVEAHRPVDVADTARQTDRDSQ